MGWSSKYGPVVGPLFELYPIMDKLHGITEVWGVV